MAGALHLATRCQDVQENRSISYFVTGSGFVTLPVEIYNYTKKPIHPKLYALFTLMFIVILALMILMNVLQAKADKRKSQSHTRQLGGVS